MLPNLKLLSTKHVEKLFIAQTREFNEATDMNVPVDELNTIELTLQQLSSELQVRSSL